MRIRSVTFIVKDIEAAKQFYEKLGFKAVSGDFEKVVLQTDEDNQNLVLLKESKSRKLAGNSICSLYKENVPGFFQKCKIIGVPFEKDLRDTDEGKVFAFRDPDGNGIEIIEKSLPKNETENTEEEKQKETKGEPEYIPVKDRAPDKDEVETEYSPAPEFKQYIED